MRMFAEMLDQAGSVLFRAEAEVRGEADLVELVTSVNDQFSAAHPTGDPTKDHCTIKIGAASMQHNGSGGSGSRDAATDART